MSTPSELRAVAKLAAIHAIRGVREQITDLVQYETMKVLPEINPENIQPKVDSPRFERAYVEPPAKPVSNYAQTLIRSIQWRSGKGERLAIARLKKPGTSEELLVEQFGDECSVLRKDESQPRATLHTNGTVKIVGKSIWTQFDSVKGRIDQVVAKLLLKGWVVQQPTHNAVQLLLVDGM